MIGNHYLRIGRYGGLMSMRSWTYGFDSTSELVSYYYVECSRISHYQQRYKRSVTSAVWLLALLWRMMEFCTTKFSRFLRSPCDYDLFVKEKEPLQGTRYNIRDELIRAIGRSIRKHQQAWTRWWYTTPSKHLVKGDK